MDTFKAYMLLKVYKQVQKLGDKLIDWDAFRPIITPYTTTRAPREAGPMSTRW